MKRRLSSPLARSGAFILLAVAITVAIAALTSGGGDVGKRTSATAPTPRHALLKPAPGEPSAQEQADYAIGVPGVHGTLYPLAPAVFDRPIARYRRYARRGASQLRIQVAALSGAIRSGDRTRARALWNQADSTFTRLGAAYGALGRLGDAIDGGPGGLPHGDRDARFSGLQRIEKGLWSDESLAALKPFTTRLQRDVAKLPHALKTSAIEPLDYALRVHEILEDAQRDRLDRSEGADAGVRAVADSVAATNVVIGTLAKTLAQRGQDAFGQSQYWLGQLAQTLAAIKRAHGNRYPTVGALTTRERETLNGRLGAALEALAGIPDLLDTVKHQPLPKLPG